LDSSSCQLKFNSSRILGASRSEKGNNDEQHDQRKARDVCVVRPWLFPIDRRNPGLKNNANFHNRESKIKNRDNFY
jgi:hypothetical protein